MPPRVARLLYITLLAPVTALVAATAAPLSAHAQTPTAGAPPPYVVCVDPGHGGAADNNDPSQLFDPGAIGVNGLEEKVATLDVGLRLRDLLQKDGVTVAMTRTSDTYVSISDREAACEAANANVFVSVHLNYFTDPAVNGSLILYPNQADLTFASTMSATLGKELAAAGVPNTGTQLRDDWWIHATMPTITVEGAYLTSPHDAAWLGTTTGREQLASAIRDGIEAYDPTVLRHKQSLAAWSAAHPTAAASSPANGADATTSKSDGPPWTALLLAVFMIAAAVKFPNATRRVAHVVVTTVIVTWEASQWATTAFTLQRHRRRRRRRARNLTGRAMQRRRQSVYDELRL